MRLTLLAVYLILSLSVSSQSIHSFPESNKITIEIIIEEPFCSLCLLQLNQALASKDLEKVTFIAGYIPSNTNDYSITEIRIREYLKDINFDFKIENYRKNDFNSPYLIIRNSTKEEIVSYEEIFNSFNKKKLTKHIKKVITKMAQTQI